MVPAFRGLARLAPARLGLLALIALCVGCGHDKEIIEFDPRFSLNVVKVPDWFPGKKKSLTPAQEEVFVRRGAPNFVHFWWNDEGNIITSSDFSGKSDDLPKMMKDAKQTWVYSSGKDRCEIEFNAQGGYMQHPITEKLDLLCRYGDPYKHTPPKADKQARMIETWIWVDHGVKITIADGKIINKESFTGTGAGTDLLK